MHADTFPRNLLGGIVRSIARRPGEAIKAHPCEALIPANGSDALSQEVEHETERQTIIVTHEHANRVYTDEVVEQGRSTGVRFGVWG